MTLEAEVLNLAWTPGWGTVEAYPAGAAPLQHEYTVLVDSQTNVGCQVRVGSALNWRVQIADLAQYFEDALVRFAVVTEKGLAVGPFEFMKYHRIDVPSVFAAFSPAAF